MKRLEKLITESTASEKKRAEDVIAYLKALSGHNYLASDKKILTDAAEIVQNFYEHFQTA